MKATTVRPGSACGKKRAHNSFVRWIKRDYGCYLFLSPAILGFFIFTVYPIFASLCYSFTDFNGMFITKIGIFNFANIFDASPSGLWNDVGHSFIVTFINTLVSVPLGQGLSFFVSLLLLKEMKGVKTFRLLYYLPTIIPGIAGAMIWMDMFSYDNGIINEWITAIGLPRNTFFEGEKSAMYTLWITGLWGIGGNSIMWLAAFNNVSPEILEASKLDGAGYFRRLFLIMVPMCTPIIFYNLITGMIGTLQYFNSYAMVGTGPDNSLNFIAVNLYTKAFTGSVAQMGLACAMGWLLFIVIALLTMLAFRANKHVYYGGD